MIDLNAEVCHFGYAQALASVLEVDANLDHKSGEGIPPHHRQLVATLLAFILSNMEERAEAEAEPDDSPGSDDD